MANSAMHKSFLAEGRRGCTAGQAIKNWPASGSPKQISAGIFNETYKVGAGREFFILQKLHQLISAAGPTDNYVAVTDFLRSKGFIMQTVVRAKKGDFLVKDGRRAWRLLRAVPGRFYTSTNSLRLVREAGKMFGKIHGALADFKKPIHKTLPMFRYGAVLEKLKKYSPKLKKDKNPDVRRAAMFLSDNFPKCFLPDALPKRIIHTDPKISNFIFDGRGRCISIVDWDTVQKLNPLYDLGDALRSLCGKEEDDPGNKFNFKKYNAFLAGYFSGSKDYLSAREKKLIPRAAGLVILGLATRFLNDYVDDFYFGWDKKCYKNRREHNLARALGQVALYKDFAKHKFD
ncbi:MAG: phosphotransferase [bacterium]|nr:phosphotransferase [bacterium]